MRILVSIDQKASIAAGYEAPSSTEIIDVPVADIPAETRVVIAKYYDVKSGAVLIQGWGAFYDVTVKLAQPVTTEAVISALTKIASDQKARDAKREAEQQAEDRKKKEREDAAIAADKKAADYIDALPDERDTYPDPHQEAFRSLGILSGYSRETTPLAYAALDRLVVRHNAYSKAKREREKAEAEQVAIAKKNFLSDWIAKNTAPAIARQHKDGLLAEADAVKLIRKATFGEFGLEPFKVPHVCDSNDCPCYDKYTETLPPETYTAWLAVAAKLPKDATVKFSEVRACTRDEEYADADTEPEIIYDAEIAIQAGPFELKRRVRL